ncbi:MAG: DUF2461 domain-containing protein [Bacteroidales bacterium]|jgi:uncharacterized protein (TIGR02453 family)|nr:DUF2461 domain-containing protein [Bacteroidales bacterium]
MKDCFSKELFATLKDMSANNNSQWYHENKSRVNDARKEVALFANELIPQIRKFDNTVGLFEGEKTMYRQFRDIRFSPDKSLLKTYFSTCICCAPMKQNGVPCYYLHIEETFCMIAGGVYGADKDSIKKIRDEIYYNIDEFNKIMNDKNFKKYFIGFDSDGKLKKAPKGYPNNWEYIEYLKNKHFTPSIYFPAQKAMEKNFKDYVLEVFHSLKDINAFFYKAINL